MTLSRSRSHNRYEVVSPSTVIASSAEPGYRPTVALDVGGGDCAIWRPGQNGEPRSDLQEMQEAILSPSTVDNRVRA